MNSDDLRIRVPKYTKKITEKDLVNPNYLMMRRLGSGVTLKELAKKARVSISFLSAIENGKKNCTPYVLCLYDDLEPMDGIAFNAR